MPECPPLLAAAAETDLTPERAQWLDGYGNRTGRSEGVYLPLTARALVLRRGAAAALLLSAEVLAFDRARYPALKARLAAATGIPAAAIVLAATHTHCAPRVCGMVMPGELDPEYVAAFEEACVRAGTLAAADAGTPVTARVSRARDEALGVNRRVCTEQGVVMLPNPTGPRDADVDTLWLERTSDGSVVVSVTVAACHPTSRGGQWIGGDYPGFLCRELGRLTAAPALFLLGCAGDVRPRFLNAEGRFRMAEVTEVEEAGATLARAAWRARGSARTLSVDRLTTAALPVELPLEEPPGTAALQSLARGSGTPLEQAWAERLLRDGTPATQPAEVQAWRLARDCALLFLPGEVAADYALRLKGRYEPPAPGLLTAAYCNGAVGYISTRAMHTEGGYEVRGSHHFYGLPAAYRPEVEEVLLEAADAALK